MLHAIRSRRALIGDALRPATVLVRGEHVAEVRPFSHDFGDVPVEELGERVLLPGLVDGHVHVNEPGRTDWEGFETATRAAASGGVTTLVDMPLNCIPVTTSLAAFEEKLAATEGKLWVDTGFWGGVVPGNASELAPMARAGILGAKAFLCHSGIDDFPATGEADLRTAMHRLAEAGLPLLAHAELELAHPPAGAPPRTYRAWLESRPASWEDAAIGLLIQLCRETGCAVHVVHLSAASAVPMLAEARAEGLPITVETCPHYLCLRAEDVPDGDTTYKCAPPIRDEANREGLWRALADGVIDFVVTDHSPCVPGLKHLDTGDFLEAWGGIASLSLGLSSVWTEAARRGVDLATVVRWMSAGPARFVGLEGRKGVIAPGADADLVAFDPDASSEVTADRLLFKNRISPWIGRTLRGEVTGTWLRGRRIWPDAARPTGAPLLHRR